KGHRLCCDDLKESLENDLHIYKLNLKCIVDPTCEAEYDMELIEKILDEREILRIQELQAMEAGINSHSSEEEEKKRLADLELEQQQQKKAQTEAERCNHVQCRCKEDFCYICEQSIADVMMKHFSQGSNPCPQNIDDNAKFNKERQIKKAKEKAQQFATEHPGFEDVDGKLQRLLEQYLS
ncbi:MAG: hypothetical protein EZS28_027214, partial [Streblomastix strix]